MTLTTFDEELCRILEPKVCGTRQRFETLLALQDAGIPTVVWLCPILPFLNDTKENLRGLLGYCFEAKVRGILSFGMGVTLREGDREYFYQKLDEHFPGMKERYIRAFGDRYSCGSPTEAGLRRLVRDECRARGVLHPPDEVFSYLHTFEDRQAGEQTSLF
jgi:DNA repair photolyase